jgi:hypothetical protein
MKTDNYLQLTGFIISYDHLYWSTVTHDIVVCGYFKKGAHVPCFTSSFILTGCDVNGFRYLVQRAGKILTANC